MKELIALNPFYFQLTVNAHRDNFQTVTEYFDIIFACNEEDREDIGEEVLAKMIENNTILNFTIYPRNSVGFYDIYHYDYDKLMERVNELVKSVFQP